MGAVVLVEPNHLGHRYQYVKHLVRIVDEPILLTSVGGTATEEFAAYLGDESVETHEPYTSAFPSAREIAESIAAFAHDRAVDTVVVMDADRAVKRWWLDAPPAFKGLSKRPRVVFLFTRYPARLSWRDRLGWAHRVSKAGLALLAMATGSLRRVANLAGRDDDNPGWVVKRAKDPAICSAHARDRDRLRGELELDRGLVLVGILGAISDRKNVPMVAEAVHRLGGDTRLLLAGGLTPFVRDWLARQPCEMLEVLMVRDEYLSNEKLDSYVAACDVVSIAQDNNGPSGIMGKALAAGVPVLTAGSRVRERELAAAGPGAGRSTELTVAGTVAGLRALARDRETFRPADRTLLATPEAFARAVLGAGARG
jgi:glycosyltransferase involved in cell wall biosynthesis